jgi:hypothetical protein
MGTLIGFWKEGFHSLGKAACEKMARPGDTRDRSKDCLVTTGEFHQLCTFTCLRFDGSQE